MILSCDSVLQERVCEVLILLNSPLWNTGALGKPAHYIVLLHTIEAVSQVINRYAAVNFNVLLTAPRHLAIFKTIAKESGLLFTIYTAAA